MNRRRVLTIIAAIVLTLVGTFVLFVYVNSADERAQEGTRLVRVLVASEDIEPGVAADDLAGSDRIVVREVPQSLLPDDAVRDLADEQLSGLVTIGTILEGQTIVLRQFGEPAEAPRAAGADEAGMQIMTLTLEPQRALGGELKKGDLVGVIVSLEGTTGAGTDDTTTTSTDEEAKAGLVLSGVEVTAVAAADPETAQAGDLVTVSLLVDETAAERVAYGAEFGRLWLTRQGEGAGVDDSQRTRDNIFRNIRVDEDQ